MGEIVENEFIDSYTRAEAIADGILIDVTGLAVEAGFSCPVALTIGVHERYVKTPEDMEDTGEMNETGRLWDILMILRHAAGKSAGRSEILFRLSAQESDGEIEVTTLKAVCDSDDDGEMCFTVMLPEED